MSKKIIQFGLLLFLALLCPRPSFAAWSLVGCNSNIANLGSTSTQQTYTAGAGHLISVGGGAWASPLTTVPSISDTLGLTFTGTYANDSYQEVIGQWWAIANGSADTITITWNQTSNIQMAICEFSNTGTLSQDGSTYTGTTGATAATTVSVVGTATNSGELGVSWMINRSLAGSGSASCSTGWNTDVNGSFGAFFECDNESVSSGSNMLTYTYTSNQAVTAMQFFTNASAAMCKPELAALGAGAC
jgi:hypothetical protein